MLRAWPCACTVPSPVVESATVEGLSRGLDRLGSVSPQRCLTRICDLGSGRPTSGHPKVAFGIDVDVRVAVFGKLF